MHTKISNLKNKYFLTQMIHKVTHKAGNTLDLLFTNNKQLINDIQCFESNFSDHYLVEISTHFKSHFTRAKKSIRKSYNLFDSLNFFNDEVNWDQIKQELQQQDWDTVFENLQPADKLTQFTSICESIAVAHTPKRKSSNSKRSKVPRDRRILMRRRRRITLQLAKFPAPSVTTKLNKELVEIEIKLQDSYSSSTSIQEQRAVQAIKNNPKYFFSYVKKFSKVKPSIGPLLNAANHFATTNDEMGELLRTQYSSVFSNPTQDPINPNLLFTSEDTNDLIDIVFSEMDFIKAIDELSMNAAPGPDGFPAILLKQCNQELTAPLYNIWRQCLDLGVPPSTLKQSNIIPIHKGDSTAHASNYRPVALTSHLVKIFEKVLRTHIINYLEENTLLNPSQHGFRAGRSCLSQLIAHYDKILSLLDEGGNVDVIYLDFAKAFDKLDFNITLTKLKSLGITGKVGKWIHSFLTNRSQSVMVNGEKSSPAPVISGVPQGSVIGPLLFLILIGDIDKDVYHSFLSSFADDTRIGKGISTPEDSIKLQEDLNTVYNWASTNNMQFNHKKFELLRYGTNSELQNSISYISNSGQPITVKSSTKDLGVIMSSTGGFNEHINGIIDTVRDLSAWILRSFKSRSRLLMLQLWKSVVIPRLEYCSQLWNPHQVSLIQQLEELQKSFVRHISGFRNMDYWTALNKLGLYSLQRRRERYQVIYLWSMLEGIVPNIPVDPAYAQTSDVLIKPHSQIESRRGRTIYIQPLHTSRYSSLRYHSLPFAGARLFNALPKDLRNCTDCSKDCFKSKLDSFLGIIPDSPLLRSYTYSRQVPTNSLIDTIPLATMATTTARPTRPRREESAPIGDH